MQIAILGGTGDIGEGLALRFARDTDHPVVVGSRKEEKALDKATEYHDRLSAVGTDADLAGTDNESAVEGANVVIVGIPPQYVVSTVESLVSKLDEDAILVSPAVAMVRDESGFHYDPPADGSIARALKNAVPDDIPVVSAFQNLAAGALSDLESEIATDVVVTGNDPNAKAAIADLAEEVDGLRALDGGNLANSTEVESITPLLINLAMNNDGMHDLGLRFE